MQHSILYFFNPKYFVKIRNRSTQTKINIFSDFCNFKKQTKNKTEANILNLENKHFDRESKNP